MGRQRHFYGLNHLRYLTTRTCRCARPFDRRVVSSPDPWPWLSFRFGYRQDPFLLAMDPMRLITQTSQNDVCATPPDLSPRFDQRSLVLETWGFLVPFVWGFSAKWLPVFLGLRRAREGMLLSAVALNSAGVLAAMTGWARCAVYLLLGGIIAAVCALRFLEPAQQPAKVKGVHTSFPVFVRLAYVWAVVAASLGIWASAIEDSHGIWGASRHALTVGFLATMVFTVGQRILPAFAGMRPLFSTKLMFLSLLLLTTGCLLRVSSEILAYQGIAGWVWSWLPVSAVVEMTAVTTFAFNLLFTFSRRPH